MEKNSDSDYIYALSNVLFTGEGTNSSPYKLTKKGILFVFLAGVGLTISLFYLFVRNILSIFNKR